MVITGIPNFDNAGAHLDNDFPHRDFVLVCTSNSRETFKRDNRRRFLRKALTIAGDRPVIFKLHPGERHGRAIQEIRSVASDALIFRDGNTEHMIANCAALVAHTPMSRSPPQRSAKRSTRYIDPEFLRRTLPIQNGGTSAANIAEVCRGCLESSPAHLQRVRARIEPRGAQAFPLANIQLMPR